MMCFSDLFIKVCANYLCLIGYGLTEASPMTHCNGPEGNKYHTVGAAVNNTQFKVSYCILVYLKIFNKGKHF